MAIHVFILTLLILLLAFIGLVVLIYGFKNNILKNIKIGTILVSIALILFTIMSYKVTNSVIRHYKQKVHSIGVMMNQNCMGNGCFEKEIVIVNDSVVPACCKKK